MNTASPALLRYVSGLNQLTARRVFDFRGEHGPFRSREQLKEVPGFGEAAFVQAAGFLKIVGRDNPLDATWIHPESYPLAAKVLESIGANVSDLADNESAARVAERAAQTPVEALAAQCEGGTLLLGDILWPSWPAPAATRAKICRRRSSKKGSSSSTTCRRGWSCRARC